MSIFKTKSQKILEEHLPKLEDEVKDIKNKTMSPEVAEKVTDKADEILATYFKGKQLVRMRKQLAKTMKVMQKNYGDKKK